MMSPVSETIGFKLMIAGRPSTTVISVAPIVCPGAPSGAAWLTASPRRSFRVSGAAAARTRLNANGWTRDVLLTVVVVQFQLVIVTALYYKRGPVVGFTPCTLLDHLDLSAPQRRSRWKSFANHESIKVFHQLRRRIIIHFPQTSDDA